MNRAVCQMAISLLLTTASVALAAGPAEPQNNPFEAPILDVRPRVFIRQGSFEGLTIARLREAAGQLEFALIRAKWKRKPLGQAIEWMITGDRQSMEAAIDGLKNMEASDGSWTHRGMALVRLATLFDWLYDELDQSMRAEVMARIEQAADRAVEHIREGRAPFFYTRTPGALAGVAISGIALHGISDKADGYLDVFRQFGVNEYFKAYQWVDGAATSATYTLDRQLRHPKRPRACLVAALDGAIRLGTLPHGVCPQLHLPRCEVKARPKSRYDWSAPDRSSCESTAPRRSSPFQSGFVIRLTNGDLLASTPP